MSEPASSVSGEGSVTVVGTAHVSADSVREVEEVIERERPDVVAVELDEGRYRQMQGDTPDDIDPRDLLRGNTVFQFLAYWMLSYVQAQLGEKFDIKPGADMLAAVETAESLGIDVALVDRDIQTTIQRFWARMSVVEKLRMVGGLVFGITDSRVVGLTLGLLVGLVLGPLIGLFGGSVGITEAVLTRVTGGVLLGVVVAFVIDTVGDSFLDGDERFLAALTGGLLVATGGLFTGVADGVVSTYLGSFAISAVGSLAIGVSAGLVFGAVVGLIVDLTGLLATEDVEDFDIEDLTDMDVVTVMMEEFREFSPGGAEALIDERDAYIGHQLVALRRGGADVVAVVGAGHREGIESYLADPSSLPPMESLVGVAKKRGIPWAKIAGVLVSVGFVGFFVLLAIAGVRDVFLLQLFAAWFLVNGVFAAGLAKLAGARWTSALVGGGVAWMTSVNPLLAPGWFTGYLELRHTPVNVGDIGTLNSLIADEEKPLRQLVGEMLDVPLFRLITVVAMTNIGSVVASLLFVAYVLPLFTTQIGGVEGVSEYLLRGAARSADFLWGTLT
ncbi:MAG: TraB/GumN family protein [Halobacteriota archaeon]